MERGRFIKITDQELIETEEEQGNQNTNRKTAYDVELFKSFISISILFARKNLNIIYIQTYI